MIQFILLLFMSSTSWSTSSSPECSTTTSMDGVKDCIEVVEKAVDEAGKLPTLCDTIPKEQEVFVLETLAEPFGNHGAVCTNFIANNGKTGEYGAWGKVIVDYLKAKGSSSVFMNSELAGMSTGVGACPNWKNMTNDEREHFWVWVMAAISKVESTCLPKARNGAGTNGVAIGLVQLDERHSMRKWRGENCKVSSVNEPDKNLLCGLDILSELLKGKEGDYKSNGELWGRGSNSYWQHLRKADGGEISELIKLNPYCKR